jgi:biotin carboxylase
MAPIISNHRPRLCAIVDAQGTGRFLPEALLPYGTQCVHVQSASPDIHIPADQHGIAVQVQHEGDVEATAAALRELGADYVFAGAEAGVELANVLANRLGLPGNGMSNPRALRNKHEMARTVREAGLAAVDSCLSASADDLVAWARVGGKWPVVLKPAESAGGDNVIFCFSAGDIRRAYERIMASSDRYGRQNTSVLAQQFLTGEEYYVNTISRNGIHHIAEIWHYHKRWAGNRLIYDYEHPVPATSPVAMSAGSYVLAVLDALEIYNGAGHTEVMYGARGPVLVECGARLGGSQLPHIASRCFGTDQVKLTALSIARPVDFARIAGEPYRLATRLRYVSLINPQPGVVPASSALEPIRSLPSFVEMALTEPEGRPLPQTVDLRTSAGFVYLMSADADRLNEDYRRLRALEETGLYEKEMVAASA